jgi:hypothetical protein
MTIVRVAIVLPYHLSLPRGEYRGDAGDSIKLARVLQLGGEQDDGPRTQISAVFGADDNADRDSASSQAAREASRLLRQTNRLLRWYRQLTSIPSILEVTRAQVSPFRFFVIDDGLSRGLPPKSWVLPVLEFEAEEPTPQQFSNSDQLAASLRQRLSSSAEPDVAQLNLLDARHAKSVGRFRESVLLSWSVIDSSFVSKFEALVEERLSEEWGETRKFLKGQDFGLRHKMTSGLRLIAGRSLFNEPNDFWKKLSESYDKRNRIIHAGAAADEDDAQNAIDVATQVVRIVSTL